MQHFFSFFSTTGWILGLNLREHPGLSRKWAFVHSRLQDGDTIRVDGHPNALSHRIITRAILDGLGYSEAGVR